MHEPRADRMKPPHSGDRGHKPAGIVKHASYQHDGAADEDLRYDCIAGSRLP